MGTEDSARGHKKAIDVEGAVMDTQSIKDKADLDEEVVNRTGELFSLTCPYWTKRARQWQCVQVAMHVSSPPFWVAGTIFSAFMLVITAVIVSGAICVLNSVCELA